MRWLDLGLGLVLFVACGGKVVVDQEPAGTTGNGGSSSAASTVTSSSSSGDDCTALKEDYEAKVAAALACSPVLGIVQCDGSATVPAVPGCCGQIVNETQPQLVQAAKAAYAAYVAAGCETGPCPLSCPAFKGACQPSPDGTTGMCTTFVE